MAITAVNASDTLDQGRIKFNANDQSLQTQADSLQSQQTSHLSEGHPSVNYTKSEVDTQQSAQDAALEVHKASGDHDARYLSASYLATLVRTAFNQTIAGTKTFLAKLIIAMTDPTLELRNALGASMARFWSTEITGGFKILRLSIIESGAWKEVFEAIGGNTFVNFPNHDVQSKGNRLATESFVAQQVANSGGGSSAASIFVLYDSPQLAPSLTDPTSPAPDYPTYEGGGITLIPKIKLKYLHRAGIRHIRVYGKAQAGGSEDPIGVRVQVGTINATTMVYTPTFSSFTVALDVSTLEYGTLYDLGVGIVGEMSDSNGFMRELFIVADTL